MKSCIPHLRKLLVMHPDVAALVGSRVYVNQASQGQDVPDIVLRVIAGSPQESLEGAGGPWRRRVSVTCRATSMQVAETVGEAVLNAIGNFRGIVDGMQFQSCVCVSDVHTMDDTTNLQMRVLDFRIFNL